MIRNQQVNGSSPFVGSIKFSAYPVLHKKQVAVTESATISGGRTFMFCTTLFPDASDFDE